MSVFITRVSDEDKCFRLRHRGLSYTLRNKVEKNWEVRLSEKELKSVETFCKKNRLRFRPVPRSYGRIPKSRRNGGVKTDPKLWDMLYDYQKQGVSKIVCKFGSRALLADDMGLGKSIQGCAYISHRLNVFPESRVLIVCPSYLQIHWQTEILRFIGRDSDIWDKKPCPEGQIVIIPYSKLSSRDVSSVKWETVVADESHYVKNRSSKRSQSFIPLCHRCSGVLLMSGTPCVNRPCELYTQMYCIRHQHVLSYHKFSERFCDGHQSRFGWVDTGCSNEDELFWLLRKEYMVRRLKRDVLTQLKPKTRYSVTLNVEAKKLRRLHEIPAEMKGLASNRRHMMKRKALVSEAYRETAKAKASEVSKWINDRVEHTEEPFIVFAHHQVMLNTLEENLGLSPEEYIRIDGSVSKEKRQTYVDRFQSGKARIALLSLKAANTGLTLTRASLCIMSEVYWTPGDLLQAEDRLHRCGQESNVSIIYLLGAGTVDTKIYPQVSYKLKVLDNAVDGRDDRSMETISII